jgi:hypothetical protein
MSDANTPVAKVLSWTSGSYWRNYKLQWLRDVPEGTELYAAVPAELAALRASRDALILALRGTVEAWERLYPTFPVATDIEDAEFREFQCARAALAAAQSNKGEAS